MRARVIPVGDPIDPSILAEAGARIREGGLVAFPTETVYGLGGNALDPAAAEKIYAAKGRPSDNPLIVHIAEMEDLYPLVQTVPEAAETLIRKYWPGPLTIILPKSERVPYATTGGLETVAVRMPDHPVARELIRAAGGYVAAPSANVSGRPSPTRAERVAEDLGETIDLILDGGPVPIGLESTIVDFSEEKPVILRPGFIGRDALQEILGEVTMDPACSGEESAERPKAPGMRYRHYAPQGELQIVEGEPEAVGHYIRNAIHAHLCSGESAGVLCAEETREQYPEGEVFCLGSRAKEETIAQRLYESLRQCDDKKIRYLYAESFARDGMGEAIMNRLRKAAGGKVIQIS